MLYFWIFCNCSHITSEVLEFLKFWNFYNRCDFCTGLSEIKRAFNSRLFIQTDSGFSVVDVYYVLLCTMHCAGITSPMEANITQVLMTQSSSTTFPLDCTCNKPRSALSCSWRLPPCRTRACTSPSSTLAEESTPVATSLL